MVPTIDGESIARNKLPIIKKFVLSLYERIWIRDKMGNIHIFQVWEST